jgi:hypothetical protein
VVFYKGEPSALIDTKGFKETFAKKECSVLHLRGLFVKGVMILPEYV